MHKSLRLIITNLKSIHNKNLDNNKYYGQNFKAKKYTEP